MRTFKFCPQQEGYSFQVGNDVKEQELEGGLPRQVIQIVGAVHNVSAQVLLKDQFERQIFWAFYRENQTQLWKWNLDLDGGEIEECICQFNNSSVPSYSFIDGVIRKVQLSVRVIPLKRDKDFDKWLLDQWEQGKINDLLDLEKIPNVWMPQATGV